MLYSIFFIVGFNCGIAVTIILLRLFQKETPVLKVTTTKQQQVPNRVIHMTAGREEKLSQLLENEE